MTRWTGASLVLLTAVACAGRAGPGALRDAPTAPRAGIPARSDLPRPAGHDARPAAPRTTHAAGTAPPAPRRRGARRAPDAEERRDELLQMADRLVAAGRYQEAVAVYDELRADDPDDPALLTDLLWACLPSPPCAPRLPGLHDELRAYLERRPLDVERRLLELDLLEALGRWAEYDRRLADLQARRPQLAEAWVLRGERALAHSDLDTAASAVSSARRGRFHDPEGRKRLAELITDLSRARAELLYEQRQDRSEFRRHAGLADTEEDLEPGEDF
jgi:tetratricopeptide (TPR) repeat protein